MRNSNNYFNVRIILKLYILVLSIFTIFRSILFFTNSEQFDKIESLSTVFLAFLMGVRFDIVISGYILLLPFIILSILFVIQKKSILVLQIIRYYLLLFFSIAFIICAIDIPYFNQFFSRFSISAFQWVETPMFILKMVLQEPKYWAIIIPLIFLLYLFFNVLKKIINTPFGEKNGTNIFFKILISLLFVVFIFVGIRGRIEKKSPIRVGTAYFSDNQFLNKLGLNPVFTLLRSYLDSQKSDNQFINLIDDKIAIENVQKYFKINKASKNSIARKILPDTIMQKQNVVIVIMESMSAIKMKRYGSKQNLTPFLDSISEKSYCFDNIYTAGIHTFNGIYSTLFSYPALFRQHPLKEVGMKQYNGISKTLKGHDYSTIFFTTHDGQFDNVEGFLKANDYEQVITQSDYPADKIKSALGVSDDYLFEYAIPKLTNLHKKGRPFFAAFMTASDHGPYIIPDYFKPNSKETKDQIVEYADWSLKRFIQMASKEKWFSNTLFVFVADHGAAINSIYSMPLNYHHSPLIIYNPQIIKENKTFDCIGGQIDIYPTIMGILNIPYVNNTLGIDLLKEKRPYIYFCADDKYGVIDDEFFLIVEKDRKTMHKYRALDIVNYYDKYKEKANLMDIYAKSNMQVTQFIIKKP